MKYKKLSNGLYRLDEIMVLSFADYDIVTKNNIVSSRFNLTDDSLIVYQGFKWDGASGPAIDDKTNIRASMFHDALYELITLHNIPKRCRKGADQVLRDLSIEDGMCRFRAEYYYIGVRLFGGAHI